MTEGIDYYLRGRLFEWVMTISMVSMAAEIYLLPDALTSSNFYLITRSIGTNITGYFLTIVGLVRLFALLLNGHAIGGYRIGPWARSISAVLCSVMWMQFALSLIQVAVDHGSTSPSIPLWFCVTFGEIYIAYRALVNAR